MSSGLQVVEHQGPSSRLTRFSGRPALVLDLLMDRQVSPRQEFGRQSTDQAFEFLLGVTTRGCCPVVPPYFILGF
jgi:hypothetical protein